MELPSRGRRWTIENASRDLFPVRKLSHSDNLVTAFVIASNPKDFPISDSPKGTVSPRITPSRPPLSPSLRNSNRITRRFSFLSLSLFYFSYPFSPPPPPLKIIKVILFPFLDRSARSSRNNGRINRRECGRHFVSLLEMTNGNLSAIDRLVTNPFLPLTV